MNIIDLLVQDHDKLRRNLSDVNHALLEPDLRNRIKLFISKYELHESIEEEILFPALEDIPADPGVKNLTPEFEKTHEKIWSLLDQVVESLDQDRFQELQRAFFKFCASVEIHLSNEERILFPTIRQRMDAANLEELGKAAEKRLDRFARI